MQNHRYYLIWYLDHKKVSLIFFNKCIIHLLCVAIVHAFSFMLSYRKERNTELCLRLCEDGDDVHWYFALKFSNAMPSIDTYLLPPCN